MWCLMRIAGETVGARGTMLLAATAVAGVVLGVHGWSGRHNGLPPALAGPQASPTVTAHARPASSPAPSSAARSAQPTQGPVASSPAAASPAPTPGPKLSSQRYASYAYQVWPGPATSAGKAAAPGLTITLRRGSTRLARRCTWSRPRWATTRATPTTTSATTGSWSPTRSEGSCSEHEGPHHPAGRPGSGRRPGSAFRCRVGADRGQGAARPGPGLVRLPRAGGTTALDRLCSRRRGDLLVRGRAGARARLGAADPRRGDHGGRGISPGGRGGRGAVAPDRG